jgi:hypothetical protein
VAGTPATPHRASVEVVGFEPTISWPPARRIEPSFPTPRCQSTQRELNPHNGPGKAVRYRYVMGALSSGGRPWASGRPPDGWISSPRCQRANRAVGPEGLEPSRHGLRARYAAANTLVPSVGPEGVEPSPSQIKSLARYHYATAPHGLGPRVCETRAEPCRLSSSSPGRNCTCLRRRIRPPCCCYNTGPSVARKGVEPFWVA